MAVAYEASPSLNFSYSYIYPDPATIECNGTTYVVSGVRYCNYSYSNITYINNTEIIYIKPSVKPQYGIYALLGLIILGIIVFRFVSAIEGKMKQKKK